jgi:hypothetical protein
MTAMKIDEKAVSETFGFILILALVLTGIGLVTLYGYPILMKEQSNTEIKNMQRAMIVIQNDMKSLCFKNVPYKETTLQVSGGTLEVIGAIDGATPKFEISGVNPDVEFSPGALVYRSDRGSEVITLENGAVMTRQEGAEGSAMLAEPRWFCDIDPTTNEKTFVIYLMKINADKQMAKSGMTTVRMSLEKTRVHRHPGDAGNVTVTYTKDKNNNHSVAWDNYLTGPLNMDGSGGTYTLSGVNKLVIKEYDIKIHGI